VRFRLPALLLAIVTPLAAEAMNVDQLVRRAAERQRDHEARSSFAFEAVEVNADLDASGRPGPAERRLYSCVRRGRSLQRELSSVDGRAPTERERRKARSETGDTKTGRLDLMDMLGRFDFRFLREELLEGRPTWVVEFSPKPRLEPRSAKDRVLAEFAGLAWIDTAQTQVLRIEGRLTREVRFAGGLALRLSRIAIVYEARPAAPGVFVPCREELRVEATAALVFPYRHELRLEFTNYRKLD
jgi:hypothetical protein